MSKREWTYTPCTDSQCGYVENEHGDPVAHLLDESVGPLMAAAPNLLEACKAIFRVAEDAFLPGPVHISIAERKCLSRAIAKAEGRDA